MDKSEKYIDMCCKAKGIQKIWIPDEGDFICNPMTSNKKGDGFINSVFVNYKHQPDYYSSRWELMHDEMDQEKYSFNIWLPRQDQLQDITCKELNFINKLQLFYGYTSSYKPNINSMEQLWLSFVMMYECKKEWIDNDWKIK